VHFLIFSYTFDFKANVGDSRAVASVRGHAQLLSFDHKPHHDREMRRINAAGGFVEFNRVNGNLALSRAFGDFVFKKNENRRVEEQIVSGKEAVIWDFSLFKSYNGVQWFSCRSKFYAEKSKGRKASGDIFFSSSTLHIIHDVASFILLNNGTCWASLYVGQ